jgi:hypothetical protein
LLQKLIVLRVFFPRFSSASGIAQVGARQPASLTLNESHELVNLLVVERIVGAPAVVFLLEENGLVLVAAGHLVHKLAFDVGAPSSIFPNRKQNPRRHKIEDGVQGEERFMACLKNIAGIFYEPHVEQEAVPENLGGGHARSSRIRVFHR